MSRETMPFENELEASEASFREVEPSPIMQAVEAAEANMVPLMLEADTSEHIAEEFALPGLPVAEAKSKGLSVKKVIIAALEERRAKYTKLKISGINDKAGAKLVYEARIEMKNIRLHFEKAGKRLTEDSKAYIKNVGIEGKQLIALSSVTEDYLEAEEKAYTALVDAEKAAKQKALDDRNQARMDALLAVGATIGLAAVVTMDDQAYVDYLALVTKAFEEKKAFEAKQAAEAEAKAKAEAEAKAKAEQESAEKLEAERKANAESKAENDRVAAELKAAMDKFNADRAQAEAAAQAEQARKDAEAKAKETAEKNRLEDIAKAERDAKDEAEKAQASQAKAAALEAAKPDAEKLFALADFIKSIDLPAMSTETGKAALIKISQLIDKLTAYTREQAESLITTKPAVTASKNGILI